MFSFKHQTVLVNYILWPQSPIEITKIRFRGGIDGTKTIKKPVTIERSKMPIKAPGQMVKIPNFLGQKKNLHKNYVFRTRRKWLWCAITIEASEECANSTQLLLIYYQTVISLNALSRKLQLSTTTYNQHNRDQQYIYWVKLYREIE